MIRCGSKVVLGRLSLFLGSFSMAARSSQNIWVYIDGFNLYNGILARSPYKWLDLSAFARNLMPNDSIGRIKFFTSSIIPRPTDPLQHIRQQAYWNALRTKGDIEIIQGLFKPREKWLPLASEIKALQALADSGNDMTGFDVKKVRVYKVEEKGTDVNLASHLVNDAHLGRYDTAVIVSNDSDLVEAIKLVRTDAGKNVGVFKPNGKKLNEIKAVASFYRNIENTVLAASQFPDPVVTSNGSLITKPTTW